jgi:hypothetical protein
LAVFQSVGSMPWLIEAWKKRWRMSATSAAISFKMQSRELSPRKPVISGL